MATQSIELSNGARIFAEVELPSSDGTADNKGLQQLSNTKKAVDLLETGVDETKQAIHGLASDLYEAVKGVSPDQVEIEVGLELKIGGTVWLASADSKASIKLKLAWKNEGRTAAETPTS